MLFRSGKQIILCADRSPAEIAGIEERLLSRFRWGLSADVQPPDLETRTAILQRHALEAGLELTGEVIDYIAYNVKDNKILYVNGRDGPVFIGASTEAFWQKVRDALALPVQDDRRFSDMAARVEHRDELTAIIESVLGTMSNEEVLDKLWAAGVPAAPVLDVAGVVDGAVIAVEASDTAQPVVIKIQPIGQIPQPRANDRRD